jgi:hypothetical protein
MHIFISYDWTCQQNAMEVEKELCSRNGIKQEVKTIMDINDLKIHKKVERSG